MLPTSTNVSLQIARTIPAEAAVVAFLPEKARALPEDARVMDEASRAAATRVIGSGVFRGKANEVNLALAEDDRAVVLVGLGAASKLTTETLRQAGGAAAKALRRHRLNSAALLVPGELPAGVDTAAAVEALAGGVLLASFRYEEYKGAVTRKKKAEEQADASQLRVTLIVPAAQAKASARALQRARAVADGQNFARTIAWRPGNDINPPALARVAQLLAKETGLTLRVLDEKEMSKLGMGGILAVGAGSSATPPRMIVLEYNRPTLKPLSGRPSNATARKTRAQSNKTLLIVGKAITFDTGGISIKPAEKMGKMIFDKCGGMAVLGLMYAVARLKPAIPVVGILSSAENHISETAYRPGDVLRMYNGVTVEVTNTDAEGRLVLADALAWGIERYQPAAVIDLATLTGGVVVALGRTMAGIMANDDNLVAEIQQAADRAGEKLWRLPLGDDQRDQIKSEPADIVNSAGRDAHPLQGGAFLSHFIPDGTPWAHLDIAGVADTDKELPCYAKGATGWGVRTLVEWVQRRVR